MKKKTKSLWLGSSSDKI